MEKYYLAKSYQNSPKLGEPYIKNNKKYIDIQMKSGLRKTVRVYTKNEYYKLYPEDENKVKTTGAVNLKRALGFEFGDIHLPIKFEEEEMLAHPDSRYHTTIGWYFPADKKPVEFETVSLPWAAISVSDSELKARVDVETAISNLLYAPTASAYQGSIGERIIRTLTVVNAVSKETQYGHTLIYEMTDTDANQYLWASSSKTTVLEVGGTYTLKGTVKEYTNSKNNKITILTRCKEEK